MLSEKITEILNEQIEKEGYSSHLYLAMASWAEVNGLNGVANWLYAQADEERMHMLKIVKYMNERGGHAEIAEIKKPPTSYDNVKQLFNDVLKHEQYITASINDIVALCIQEKDYTTHSWINWFVNEQIEEEASVNTIIDKLKLIGDGNLYHFDNDIMNMRAEMSSEAE